MWYSCKAPTPSIKLSREHMEGRVKSTKVRTFIYLRDVI